MTQVDTWVTPLDRPPVKLLVCDMDSTIIPTESLDELAAYVGVGDRVASITEKAMRGELDFVMALNARVKLLAGLTQDKLDDCVRQTTFNPGAAELVRVANEKGIRTVLVSGGFAPFVQHVVEALGFDHWVANTLDIRNRVLTGNVLEPIVTKDTKLEVLRSECETLNISMAQAVTIGDGANDLAMLRAAGTGIAYRAKPLVLAETSYHCQHSTLAEISALLNA